MLLRKSSASSFTLAATASATPSLVGGAARVASPMMSSSNCSSRSSSTVSSSWSRLAGSQSLMGSPTRLFVSSPSSLSRSLLASSSLGSLSTVSTPAGPLVFGRSVSPVSFMTTTSAVSSDDGGSPATTTLAAGELWVGGLNWNTTEQTLTDVFSAYGKVDQVRLIFDRTSGRSRGFAFVKFDTEQSAAAAQAAVDQTVIDGRTIKVNSSGSPRPPRNDRGGSGSFSSRERADRRGGERTGSGGGAVTTDGSLFIGGLNYSTSQEQLSEVFSAFGDIANVRIVRDAVTQQSKGFAFVTFTSSEAASAAREALNGRELDGRNMRVEATSGAGRSRTGSAARPGPPASVAPSTNLFVAGLSTRMDRAQLEAVFAPYGTIESVRITTDKVTQAPRGFAFVKFDSQTAADSARAALDGAELDGKAVRVEYARSLDVVGGGGGGRAGGRAQSFENLGAGGGSTSRRGFQYSVLDELEGNATTSSGSGKSGGSSFASEAEGGGEAMPVMDKVKGSRRAK